jgi:hypothetical protein
MNRWFLMTLKLDKEMGGVALAKHKLMVDSIAAA